MTPRTPRDRCGIVAGPTRRVPRVVHMGTRGHYRVHDASRMQRSRTESRGDLWRLHGRHPPRGTVLKTLSRRGCRHDSGVYHQHPGRHPDRRHLLYRTGLRGSARVRTGMAASDPGVGMRAGRLRCFRYARNGGRGRRHIGLGTPRYRKVHREVC